MCQGVAMENVRVRRKDLIKNRKDKRYTEKQERLECAIGKLLKLGWISRLKTSKVSNAADVRNSTFYNHYSHMDEAIDSYFHKMDLELRVLAEELLEPEYGPKPKSDKNRESVDLEFVFFRILYFVYRNRKYYEVIIGQGYSQALMRIAEPFQQAIKQGWSNYGIETEDKCFCVFSWELGGVLYYWGSFENFDYDRIPRYAKRLSRLAQNTTKRLIEE